MVFIETPSEKEKKTEDELMQNDSQLSNGFFFFITYQKYRNCATAKTDNIF